MPITSRSSQSMSLQVKRLKVVIQSMLLIGVLALRCIIQEISVLWKEDWVVIFRHRKRIWASSVQFSE